MWWGERGRLQIFCKNLGPLRSECGQFVYFVNILSPGTKSETVTILNNKQNLKMFVYPSPRGGEPAILHRNPDQWHDCPADIIVSKLTLIDNKTSYHRFLEQQFIIINFQIFWDFVYYRESWLFPGKKIGLMVWTFLSI